MNQITQEELEEAIESNQGWCTHCRAFTHDFCEPDARRYECPECGKPTCYGAEEAVMMGLITI